MADVELATNLAAPEGDFDWTRTSDGHIHLKVSNNTSEEKRGEFFDDFFSEKNHRPRYIVSARNLLDRGFSLFKIKESPHPQPKIPTVLAA